MNSDYKKGEFLISTVKTKLQMDIIYNFISNSYWAKDIPFEILRKAIDNSLCFGVYKGKDQIGFARVITDYATFAYLADVFILEKYRGLGLSKWLMKIIIDFPALQGLRGWMLKTKDAHGLYSQYGFDKPKFPERVMEYSPLKDGYVKQSKE